MRVASLPPGAGEVFVANHCALCGKILPAENARFCTDCGNKVSSSHQGERSLSDSPPAWMKQLETSFANDRPKIHHRELHVKVWKQNEIEDIPYSEKSKDFKHEVEVEDDLPTRPLAVTNSPIIFPQSNRKGINTDDVEVEDDLPTRPLIAIPPQSTFSPAQPVRQTPPASIPVPVIATHEKKHSKRLALVCGLFFIVLLGGGVTWYSIVRPFTVPAITQTSQSYQNTSLGISLHYPQKWTKLVNQQNASASFYDDNHTDQVTVTAVSAGNQNINQFVSKTASSLGMTGQTTLTSLSFAGASWQQVQGTVLQSGANYSATLLGTEHANRFYTILQLAPSSTYALENQLVFANIHASFHFI